MEIYLLYLDKKCKPTARDASSWHYNYIFVDLGLDLVNVQPWPWP